MTAYTNVPTTQAATRAGGHNTGGGGNGGDNDKKRRSEDDYEQNPKRTRGGKLRNLQGRCLHCERDGHQWHFCINHTRHAATALGVGDGNECQVIKHEHPQWYDSLSEGMHRAARARARHVEQSDPARGTWDERSYLQETITGLRIEGSHLLWRAQLAGQTRAAAEARLAVLERRQEAVAPPARIQASDRRLAPISEYRLAPTHRLARNGPYGGDFDDAYAPRDATFGNGSAPLAGPRSAGSSLVWDDDEGRGGVRGATRDGYYAR
ncbi:hypothetical protein LTR56_020808 [Elasticomyces elasticus]|nr:hypothetical protein LTR56_020808 [Elasticomyces elasticus]KAK4905220.1 hypothetical protein LTR49_025455 [Elasticomyces elasticus]